MMATRVGYGASGCCDGNGLGLRPSECYDSNRGRLKYTRVFGYRCRMRVTRVAMMATVYAIITQQITLYLGQYLLRYHDFTLKTNHLKYMVCHVIMSVK